MKRGIERRIATNCERVMKGMAVIALTASSAGCVADSPPETTPPPATTPEESLTYEDVAEAIADGPVWVAPYAVVGEQTTAIRPFVANDGDISCSTAGEVGAVLDGEVYVVSGDSQLAKVDMDNATVVARKEGVTKDTVNCVAFEPLVDSYDGRAPGFAPGQIPQWMLVDGEWYQVATEVESGQDPSTLLDTDTLNQ